MLSPKYHVNCQEAGAGERAIKLPSGKYCIVKGKVNTLNIVKTPPPPHCFHGGSKYHLIIIGHSHNQIMDYALSHSGTPLNSIEDE